MAMPTAQEAYAQAVTAYQTAVKAVKAAQAEADHQQDRMEQAEQDYLNALGAPAEGAYVPFNAQRILKVTQRTLSHAPRSKKPIWSVGGSLHEAKDGQWVQVKHFDHLRQADMKKFTPEAWAADLQARLAASRVRAARQRKDTLRLGANELAFLNTMKFATGTSFRAPRGVVYGQSGTLRGNVLIAENLHRKGVLRIPTYVAATSYSVTPGWYDQPMELGPRAKEARQLLARDPRTPLR